LATYIAERQADLAQAESNLAALQGLSDSDFLDRFSANSFSFDEYGLGYPDYSGGDHGLDDFVRNLMDQFDPAQYGLGDFDETASLPFIFPATDWDQSDETNAESEDSTPALGLEDAIKQAFAPITEKINNIGNPEYDGDGLDDRIFYYDVPPPRGLTGTIADVLAHLFPGTAKAYDKWQMGIYDAYPGGHGPLYDMLPDLAGLAQGVILGGAARAGAIMKAAEEAAAEAAAAAAQANKLHHIFDKAEHNLGGLVEQFGSQKKAFDAVQQAANQALRAGKLVPDANRILPTGNAGYIIDVDGTPVRIVGGRVKDGVVEIATFSRKGL
jgi:hypothetical protein